MRLGNGDCGCNGLRGIPTAELSGMGLTLPAELQTSPTQEPWYQTAARQIEEWFRRSPSSASPTPVYTPPGFPTSYPGEYGSESYIEPETNWTPILLVGLGLLILTRGRR